MQQKSRKTIVVFCFLILALAACGRKTIPLGEIPPAQAPDLAKRTNTMSMAFGYAQQQGYKVIHNRGEEQRIQGMVDRLAHAAGAQGFSYPVVLLDAGEAVNAAAMNGSIIMVYEALLRKVRGDDELATILGHEMGHIVAKHADDNGSEDRAKSAAIGSTLVGLAAGMGAAIAGADASAVSLAQDTTSDLTNTVATGAFVRAYDRDMEREADQIGLMIMAKAGYDPEAAIRLWSRAEEIFGAGGGGGSFLSTHPSSGDRMKRLQDAMPIALKYYEESKKHSRSAHSAEGTTAAKKAKKKKAPAQTKLDIDPQSKI